MLVFDNLPAAEVTAITLSGEERVSDSAAATESVSLAFNPLLRSVVDTDEASDDVVVRVAMQPVSSDAVASSEDARIAFFTLPPPIVVPVSGRGRAADAPVRFCVTNLVGAPGVVITGSSEVPTTNPATNIARPGRPLLPWRTATVGEQDVVVDFLTAKILTGIWLIRTNFSMVTIEGNDTNAWTAPAFSQSFLIHRNTWNFRYQLAVPLAGFNFRFLRLLIPSQTPVDGASTYLLGGVYAGVLEQFPRNFRYDFEFATVQPVRDVSQEFGGWRQRLVMGEPLAQLSGTRMARTTRLAPGYADDLQSWQDIARRIRENDLFAIMLGSTDTAQGFVVRPINQGHWKWSRSNILRSQSPLDLEEVMGP